MGKGRYRHRAALPHINSQPAVFQHSRAQQRPGILRLIDQNGYHPVVPLNQPVVGWYVSHLVVSSKDAPVLVKRETELPDKGFRQGKAAGEPGIDNKLQFPEFPAWAGHRYGNTRFQNVDRLDPTNQDHLAPNDT